MAQIRQIGSGAGQAEREVEYAADGTCRRSEGYGVALIPLQAGPGRVAVAVAVVGRAADGRRAAAVGGGGDGEGLRRGRRRSQRGQGNDEGGKCGAKAGGAAAGGQATAATPIRVGGSWMGGSWGCLRFAALQRSPGHHKPT